MSKKAKPRATRKPKSQPASSSSSPPEEGAAPMNRGKAGKGVRQSIVSPAPTPSILPDL
jgi:hypothetical protein